MSKNNKGYLLTETIIALTVVATVITVVYTMSLGNYTKQNIELTKANTAQDLYTAKELRKFLYDNEKNFVDNELAGDYKKLFSLDMNNLQNQTDTIKLLSDLSEKLDIKYIYISKYDVTSLLENEIINSQIKNSLLNYDVENENNCQYRYIVIYNDNSYSSIGMYCEGLGE